MEAEMAQMIDELVRRDDLATAGQIIMLMARLMSSLR